MIGTAVVGIILIACVFAVFWPTRVEKTDANYKWPTIDATKLREVLKSVLIWENERSDGAIPPKHISANGIPDEFTEATIHAVAAALAREGGLNCAECWVSATDKNPDDANVPAEKLTTVLDSTRTQLDPAFAKQRSFAWDFATGLNTGLPLTTPVAWMRGLRTDGTWDPAGGVYGGDGGYIGFLSGKVTFYRDLKSQPLQKPDGTPTSNILETLPADARVVGSGPGTLHGSRGLAPVKEKPSP